MKLFDQTLIVKRMLLVLFVFPMLIEAQLPFSVGYAYRDITPTDTAYIAGHSHNRIFTGVNDPIYVKAAVITNADHESIGILTFDCIGLLHPQLEDIRTLVHRRLPSFPVDHIVMSSSHTHSGPDVVGLWGPDVLSSGVDPVYMLQLIEYSANALVEAWQHRRPARAVYAMGVHGHEWVHNISEPEELDRALTVLQWMDEQNKNVLTISNFACHPTFLDAVNEGVSSDYVGGYYQRLDSIQQGGNMFIQGAIGGWVQPEHEDKTHVQAFYRGRELANEVNRLLGAATPLEGSNIRMLNSKFNLPLANLGFRMLSEAGVLTRQFGDSVITEVAYFEIGNAAFATHPGETTPALSQRTKELMSNDGPKFIIGLGMDALGYILKPYFFDPARAIPHAEYLCAVSVGPETETYLYNMLSQLITSD